MADTTEALDVIEDSIDGVVEVVYRTNPWVIGATVILGLAAGAGLGYFLAARRLGREFDEKLEAEIESTKTFYSRLNKTDEDGEPLTPMSVMEKRHGPEAAADALRTYQGRQAAKEAVEEEREVALDAEQDDAQITRIEERRRTQVETVEEPPEVRNTFTEPAFDLEEEKKFRTSEKPYVITHDEFYAAELNYDTHSLVYYEVDDTLTDEHDKPFEETDLWVGDDNLVRFGHGSKDSNIVFVRNERLEIDYEITRSTGSYLEEVLGMLPEDGGELKHSDQRDRRRALRDSDG